MDNMEDLVLRKKYLDNLETKLFFCKYKFKKIPPLALDGKKFSFDHKVRQVSAIEHIERNLEKINNPNFPIQNIDLCEEQIDAAFGYSVQRILRFC